MNIMTKFGIAKNVKIEEYDVNKEVYTLGYIKDNKNGEYALFGFDAPTDDDPIWRFWVELGYKDGYTDTKDAEITETDKELIKGLYRDYKSY